MTYRDKVFEKTSFEGSNIDGAELDYQGFIMYGQSRGFKLCT
jgi:hypothetical protein